MVIAIGHASFSLSSRLVAGYLRMPAIASAEGAEECCLSCWSDNLSTPLPHSRSHSGKTLHCRDPVVGLSVASLDHRGLWGEPHPWVSLLLAPRVASRHGLALVLVLGYTKSPPIFLFNVLVVTIVRGFYTATTSDSPTVPGIPSWHAASV